jgi:3-dehydroquinate synthase
MIGSARHAVAVSAGGEARDYEVLVGRGLVTELPRLLASRMSAHRWAVISDETVGDLYGRELVEGMKEASLDARLFTFPAGERHKTRESWTTLTDQLLSAGCGRDTVVVALGGGVTGDLAGFVAATYLRGVPVVQVPTSLVAMIDSAVGGKTGVDTPAGKNLVGAFHPPRLVAVDAETARTLPPTERAQGLVEALKHGAILDSAYFDALEADLPALLDGEAEATERAVLRSVELKAEVVGRDEREGDYRQVLNFGHTLGHALEAASGYRLPHGSAVALGMVLEARLGERLGVTESETAGRLADAVAALGLPGRLTSETDRVAALSYLTTDKKRREGRLRCVLLRRLGEVEGRGGWSRPIETRDLEAVLD